jgi:hypothetical protein
MSRVTPTTDLRVELILNVDREHQLASAATEQARGGEHWRCRCGASYVGPGSILKGRRHEAEAILFALDAAGVTV